MQPFRLHWSNAGKREKANELPQWTKVAAQDDFTYCNTNFRAKIRSRNSSDVVAQSIKSTFQGKSDSLKASAISANNDNDKGCQLIGSAPFFLTTGN